MSIDFKKIKVGDVFSESSYYKVTRIGAETVSFSVNDSDEEVAIGKEYIKSMLESADQFVKEEEVTATILATIVEDNPRRAMTIVYQKKDDVKGKRAFAAEKKAMVEKFQKATVSNIEALVLDLIENPLTDIIPGEIRTIRGRHYGEMTELKRLKFIDMDIAEENNVRQVDTRKLISVIVGGVKYKLKK